MISSKIWGEIILYPEFYVQCTLSIRCEGIIKCLGLLYFCFYFQGLKILHFESPFSEHFLKMPLAKQEGGKQREWCGTIKGPDHPQDRKTLLRAFCSAPTWLGAKEAQRGLRSVVFKMFHNDGRAIYGVFTYKCSQKRKRRRDSETTQQKANTTHLNKVRTMVNLVEVGSGGRERNVLITPPNLRNKKQGLAYNITEITQGTSRWAAIVN